jgi:hypothetical protein
VRWPPACVSQFRKIRAVFVYDIADAEGRESRMESGLEKDAFVRYEMGDRPQNIENQEVTPYIV